MTLREQHNELLKAEADRFAARVKEMIDNFERELKLRENYANTLMLEIERRDKEATK